MNTWFEFGRKQGLIVDKFNNDRENIRKANACLEKNTADPRIISYWSGWLIGYKERKEVRLTVIV